MPEYVVIDPESAFAEAKRQEEAMKRIRRWMDEEKAKAEEAARKQREAEERAMAERKAKQRAELEERVKRRFLASGGTEAEWRAHGVELVMDELKAIAREGRDADTEAKRRQWDIAKSVF